MAIKPMTPEQKTNYINTLTNYYNTLYKATGMKIPKNILDYAVTHQISTYIRLQAVGCLEGQGVGEWSYC
jgi:hypothetical protein